MTRVLQVGTSYVTGPGGGAFILEEPTLSLALISGDLYEGTVATFRASLSKPWVDDITFTYATSNGTGSAGTDYTSSSGTGTILQGDEFVDLPVQTTLRAGAQASRTFTLTLSAASDAVGTPLVITTPAVTVTILDTAETPDLPTLTVAALATVDEGNTLTFRVTASAPFAENITFAYETSNGTAAAGTDYTATSGTGTITAESLSTDLMVSTTLRSGYQGPRTVLMTISNAETTSEEAISVTGGGVASGTIADTEAPEGTHGYWEALELDAAFVPSMSFSLRDQAQINSVSQNSPNTFATYAPGADTYDSPKDAMKVVINAFQLEAQATSMVFDPMDSSQLTIQASDLSGDVTKASTAFNGGGRQVKIDDEIVLTRDNAPFDRATGIIQLKERGAYGTTPASHASGARLRLANSNLSNQVRPTLNTEDGYTYLFTWDFCHSKNWMRSQIQTYKTFQFSSDNSIWLEPQHVFPLTTVPLADGFDPDVHVGYVRGLRSYNRTTGAASYGDNDLTLKNGFATGVTGVNPLTPFASGSSTAPFPFFQHPDRWTRMWVRIRQQADDYDILDVWVADEEQGPTQMYSGVKIDVRGNWNASLPGYENPRRINKWYCEFNTSNAYIPEGLTQDFPALGLVGFRELITYVKNFATLRWTNAEAPSDVSAYLLRPDPEGA